MRRKNLRKYRKQFNRLLDSAIRECSRENGETDLDTVYRYLKKHDSRFLGRLGLLLIDEHFRILIQKRFKRHTIPVPEAEKRGAQAELDFSNMDEFRGIGDYITYADDHRKIKYMLYRYSTEEQRARSIAHLNRGIQSDIARRDAEIAGYDFLHRLVLRYGDLPAWQLIREDREGGQRQLEEA